MLCLFASLSLSLAHIHSCVAVVTTMPLTGPTRMPAILLTTMGLSLKLEAVKPALLAMMMKTVCDSLEPSLTQTQTHANPMISLPLEL